MPTPMSSAHCSDEALNDWIDGRLDAAARADMTRHCATCDACADRAAALRRVVAAARQAPAEIAPPDPAALERAIAAKIARPRDADVVPVRPRRAAVRAAPPSRGRAIAWRLAAGIALVATTAAVTARLVRREAPAVAVAPAVAPAPAPDDAQLAANVAALRLETDHTLAALRAAAGAGDRVLAAETLRVLERSLATVDTAIAEANAALARDPGNAALSELLTRTYERKRELVRRSAMLGSRS